MEEDLKILLNNNYEILLFLYNNKVKLNEKIFCPLTQEDIALKNNISRGTLIKILNVLKKNELINMSGCKQIEITKRAVQLIRKINKL